MVERVERWLLPRPGTPGSFRLVFIGSYIAMVGALVVYSSFVNPCEVGFPSEKRGMIVALLILLAGLERFESGRDTEPLPTRSAVGLLIARMALVQGIVVLDCTSVAVFLYPVVPFAAFLSLDWRAGGIFGLLCWLLASARAWFTDGYLFTTFDRITFSVVFTLLLIFMQIIARNIEREEQSRRQARQLLIELEASHRQLQAYASQVAELAATEERNRLARDIHDSLGHHLTAVYIQLEKALAYREHNPEEAVQAVRDAKQSGWEALQDVRRSVGALRNTEGRFSLEQALTALVGRMDASGPTIALHVHGDEGGYDRFVLTTLYRVAQEGLTNVQKHAQAHHVVLDVHFGEEEVRLNLQDDGVGFDARAPNELASSPSHGFGLRGIQERLELVQGRITIASIPQQGTELIVTVPRHPAQFALDGAS